MIGAKIGELTVLRQLGQDDRWALYLAEHQVLRTRWSVRVLLPQWSGDKAAIEHFIDEAYDVSLTNRRSIVEVVERGDASNRSWCIATQQIDDCDGDVSPSSPSTRSPRRAVAASMCSSRIATSSVLPLAPRYRLGQQLGAGGMAEVFRGTMIGIEGFERPVAIKRILPGLAHQERFARMFIQEAQVIARLCHPNIVSVLDFERDQRGQFSLVLEFVDGVDLDKLLDTGLLPHSVIIFLAIEILSGLGYAHNLPTGGKVLGLVHRDLSPHNVLLSWEGAVKVSDFGLAKLREASEVSGSESAQGKFAFMSPEQLNGEPLDGRADLFSVGVMLWEMLTGERLFWDEDRRTTMCRVFNRSVPRPSVFRPVARDLEAVVMKLLERDTMARYPTAEAALDALARCHNAASGCGRVDLVKLLADRFPERVAARRARPPVAVSPAAPRRRTVTLPPHQRPDWQRRQLRRRMRLMWSIWRLALLVGAACVAVALGAFVGYVAHRKHPAASSTRQSIQPDLGTRTGSAIDVPTDSRAPRPPRLCVDDHGFAPDLDRAGRDRRCPRACGVLIAAIARRRECMIVYSSARLA